MNEHTTADERQKHPRSSVIRPARLHAGGEIIDCEVLNISAGGAKLRLPADREIDSPVALEIDPHGPTAAKVAWREGEFLGLEFQAAPVKVASLIEEVLGNPDEQRERRQYPRSSVILSGRLQAGGRIADCRVLNVSALGAKLRLLEPLEHEMSVTLIIDRFGEFPSKVMWEEGDFLGIKFEGKPEEILKVIGPALPTLVQDEE